MEHENLEPRWEDMLEIKEVFCDEFELSYRIFTGNDGETREAFCQS